MKVPSVSILEEGLWGQSWELLSWLGVPDIGSVAPHAQYDCCSSLPCGLGFSHPTSNF